MVVREKLDLTKEQAQDIVWESGYENSEGVWVEFKEISNVITGTTRWSIQHTIVVQRESDGKYFKSHYSVGATEHQDEGPYEYTTPIFTEVFPIEKTIIVYE